MHGHRDARDQQQGSFSITLNLNFLSQDVSLNLDCFHPVKLPESLRFPVYLPRTKITGTCHHTHLLHEPWESNTGPPVCAANTLLTNPSPEIHSK